MTSSCNGFARPNLSRLLLLLALLTAMFRAGSGYAAEASADNLPLGQMLLVGFAGSELQDGHPILRDIREHDLGGVILFNYGPDRKHPANNIVSPGQLRSLSNTLQAAARTLLLIAIDQEGGKVVRLKETCGFPPTVAAAELGRRNDLEETYRQADRIARTLQQAGINLNLAPVVDLNVNPANPVIGGLQRSFSTDADSVTAHARQFIRAHHAHGILCSLKHFPGHGSSTGDSHKGFVDVTATWTREELAPFRTLIGEGLADTVLTAHVFNARLDPAWPATLSKRTIKGILRGQLNFSGVVISDDLSMGAITDRYPLEEAVQRALQAGVDILLIADNRPGTATRLLAVMRRLLASGRISRQRLQRSLQRIAALKARLATASKGMPCRNRQP